MSGIEAAFFGSWHTRLAAIGKDKPKRESGSDNSKPRPAAGSASSPPDHDRQRRIRGVVDRDLDDPVPF